MQRLLLVFALLCTVTLSAQKAADCKRFHTGTFLYLVDELEDIKIVRTADRQIEVNTKTNDYVQAKITWMSDCDYQLEYENIPDPKTGELKNHVIVTRMVDVDGDVVTIKSLSQDGKGKIQLLKVDE